MNKKLAAVNINDSDKKVEYNESLPQTKETLDFLFLKITLHLEGNES